MITTRGPPPPSPAMIIITDSMGFFKPSLSYFFNVFYFRTLLGSDNILFIYFLGFRSIKSTNQQSGATYVQTGQETQMTHIGSGGGSETENTNIINISLQSLQLKHQLKCIAEHLLQ